MDSIFNDLGIFKLNSDNDPSLQQGLQYGKYRKTDLDSTTYELLQQSTTADLNSVVESMKAQNSTNSVQVETDNSNGYKIISDLDSKFQKLITEYTNTLKLVNEEAVNKQKNYGDAKNMYGKVVTNTDATNVYINNYGYTHKYSTEAWEANDKSCPTNPINDTDDALSKLPSSLDMNKGQACGAAGKMIKNTTTKEMAWVDIQGIKHVYSDNIWDKRSDSCIQRDIITLDDTQYNSIPIGGAMTATNYCMNIDVDPTLYSKLSKINKQLASLAQELVNEIDNLQTTDANLNAELQEQRSDLTSYLDNLLSDRTALQRMDNKYSTIVGQEEDSELIYITKNYELLAWILGVLAIGSITLHQIVKGK